jgi:hypothetical protein
MLNEPAWGEFVAQITVSAHGNHWHLADLGDAVCLACSSLRMTVRFLAMDGDHDVDERTREAFALWEELLVSPAERRGAAPRSSKPKVRRPKPKPGDESPPDHAAVEPGPLSLGKLVSMLDANDQFYLWPLRDMMHLLKNVKQRFRNNELTLGPDRARISGWDFSAALGGGARS